MAVGPVAFDADGLQDFDDAEDFFDAGNATEGGLAGIQKGGAKEGDRGVFGSVDGDFTVELFAAANAEALSGRVVNREDLGAKGFGQLLDHF